MNKAELLNLSKEKLVDIIYTYMTERDSLIKYLEYEIKQWDKTIERLEGTGSIRISIMQSRKNLCQYILEGLKSGKYE